MSGRVRERNVKKLYHIDPFSTGYLSTVGSSNRTSLDLRFARASLKTDWSEMFNCHGQGTKSWVVLY